MKEDGYKCIGSLAKFLVILVVITDRAGIIIMVSARKKATHRRRGKVLRIYQKKT